MASSRSSGTAARRSNARRNWFLKFHLLFSCFTMLCSLNCHALFCRCEVVLGEFLKEIKKTPSSVKFADMANILVIHCQVSDDSKLSKCNPCSGFFLFINPLDLFNKGKRLTWVMLILARYNLIAPTRHYKNVGSNSIAVSGGLVCQYLWDEILKRWIGTFSRKAPESNGYGPAHFHITKISNISDEATHPNPTKLGTRHLGIRLKKLPKQIWWIDLKNYFHAMRQLIFS